MLNKACKFVSLIVLDKIKITDLIRFKKKNLIFLENNGIDPEELKLVVAMPFAKEYENLRSLIGNILNK